MGTRYDRNYPRPPPYDPEDDRKDPYNAPNTQRTRVKTYESYRRRHRSSSRDNHHERDKYRERSRSRRRSRSRHRSSIGATAAGGMAGAMIGHKLGRDKIDTLGGLVLGAVGAREFEKHYKKRGEHSWSEQDSYRGRRDEGRGIDKMTSTASLVALGTVGGLVAGAIGVREYEKRRMKQGEKESRVEEVYEERDEGDRSGDSMGRDGRRRNDTSFMNAAKKKVGGFLG